MHALRATVVLPVRDGAGELPALLDALERQELGGAMEVLALDSGSRDGTREVLAGRRIRTLDVPPSAFDHGETRNLGARAARGASVVFLSQDAVPEPACVLKLVEALEADPGLAGAFARQVPRPDADALTRRDLAGGAASGLEPRTVRLATPEALEALPPLRRYALAAFDNVASAARRELLLAHPFARTRFGEDLEWGHRMLRLGHGLAYVPEAVVVHSHRRSARGLYRRNYLGHRLLLRLFELRTVPDRPHLARVLALAVASDLRTLAREGAGLGQWLAAPAQACAAVYGQYRGARDEALGRPYPAWA
jgi:rhamnosyltransferase